MKIVHLEKNENDLVISPTLKEGRILEEKLGSIKKFLKNTEDK
jgi:hypothetical protein